MPDQIAYFRITSLAPLHIGCGEVYEPSSFVVDPKSKELVSFDTAEFLEMLDLNALKKFSTICKKGTVVSLLELFKFMRTQADLASGNRIKVTDAFIEHYEATLKLPQNERVVKQGLNNFLIQRTAFDPITGVPYIPGSAVKGSIRTAVLNQRHRQFPHRKKNYSNMKHNEVAREAKTLEKKVLGGAFETDPFRLFKVSDFFPTGVPVCKIVYAVDRKKRPGEKETQAPYQIFETVEPHVQFIGSISCFTPATRNAGIEKPLALDEILDAVQSFYTKEKQREDGEIAGIGGAPLKITAGPDNFLFRIGRHSGAECLTINGHRSIKIMQGKKGPQNTWIMPQRFGWRRPVKNHRLIKF